MTNGTTNPLLTNTQSTIAASFLSVLSTVGLPVPVVNANDPRSQKQSDSDTAQSEQKSTTGSQQVSTTGENQEISPASLLADVAQTNQSNLTGPNLTILPAARFHAILSTTSAAISSAVVAPRNQKDNAEAASSVKSPSADNTLTVPTQPIPADVVAAPGKEAAKTVAASAAVSPVTTIEAFEVAASATTALPEISGRSAENFQPESQATAGNAPNPAHAGVVATSTPNPVMTATDVVEPAPNPAAMTTENATHASPVQPTSLSGKNDETTVLIPSPGASPTQTATLAQPALSNPAATISTAAPANVQLKPAIGTAPAQFKGPQKAASPEQIAPTEKPQPTAARGDDSGANNNTTSSASAVVSNTIQNADQHGVEFVFAQRIAQVLKSVTPPVAPTASKSNGDNTSPSVAASAVPAAQPQKIDAAQTSTATPTLSGPIRPTVTVLPNLNFGASTSIPTTAIGKSGGTNTGSSAGDGKGIGATDTSATAKTNSSQNASAATGPSSQTTQNNASPQHTQADAGQPAAMTAKGFDAVSQQVAHVAPQLQTATSGTTGATDKPHAAEIASSGLPASSEGLETAGASGVNTAKLIQALNETQMHVGMRSAEFGDISIRTAVSQQQMVAQITVDHGDLGRAIAEHVPAAQSKLGDDLGVRAAIEVTQNGMSFSHDHSSASQQQQRSFTRPVDAPGAVTFNETEITTSRIAVAAEDSDRLDIRA